MGNASPSSNPATNDDSPGSRSETSSPGQGKKLSVVEDGDPAKIELRKRWADQRDTGAADLPTESGAPPQLDGSAHYTGKSETELVRMLSIKPKRVPELR